MCGIIGQVGPSPLRSLPLDDLSHRGPDANGLWSNNRDCTLGHTRLSILDLSDRANQPMIDSTQRFVIVFNGEIYNFKELRQEHLSNEKLQSHCDTEILLLLWRKMGPACLSLLTGMFAFAIWDNQDHRLWLARDHFGQKPLVYHITGDTLTFASELNALKQCLPKLKIDPTAIDLFLGYQAVPAPWTIYQNTLKLPAGCYGLWNGRDLAIERYWQLDFPGPTRHAISEEEATERLEDEIRRSVRYCLRADVPVGCTLSGGVDSSLITAIAAEESSSRIKTFSIGFEEPAYDEREYAQMVVDRYDTDHYPCVLSAGDSQRYLDKAVTQYGEPYGDSSALPAMMVCEMASKHLKVALCGDGGDELLAGYGFFKPRTGENVFHSSVLARYRLGRQFSRWRQYFKQEHPAVKLFKRASALACPLNRVLIYEHYIREFDRRDLYQPDFLKSTINARSQYENDLLQAVSPHTNILNQMLAIHYRGYLANDLLVKMDIASMAFSLEIRVPFLDHILMQYAAMLPNSMKYRGNTGKYLLKKVAQRYLPDQLLYRPKRGFSVPVKEWMKGPLSSRLREITTLQAHPLWEFLQPQAVIRWLDQHKAGQTNHGKRLWVLLILGLWLEKYH